MNNIVTINLKTQKDTFLHKNKTYYSHLQINRNPQKTENFILNLELDANFFFFNFVEEGGHN